MPLRTAKPKTSPTEPVTMEPTRENLIYRTGTSVNDSTKPRNSLECSDETDDVFDPPPPPPEPVHESGMGVFLRATKGTTAPNQRARLFVLCFICVCAIVCIACDKEKYFFTSIVTLIVGILVNSPLDANNNYVATEKPYTSDNPSSQIGPKYRVRVESSEGGPDNG